MKITFKFFVDGEDNVNVEDYNNLYTTVVSKVTSLSTLDDYDIKYLLNETIEEVVTLIFKFFLLHIPFEIHGRKILNLLTVIQNDKKFSELLDDPILSKKIVYCTKLDQEKSSQIFNSIEKIYFSNFVDREKRIRELLNQLDNNVVRETVTRYISNYEQVEQKRKYLLEKDLNLTRKGIAEFLSRKRKDLEKFSNNTPFQNLSIVGSKLGDYEIVSTSRNLSNLYTYTPSILGKKIQYSASLLLFNTYLVTLLYRVDKNKLVFSSIEDLLKFTSGKEN